MSINGNITNKDLWELSDKIVSKLDKLDAKHALRMEIVCDRVRTLEVWRGAITAKLAIAVAGISFIMTVIWTYIRSKFIE